MAVDKNGKVLPKGITLRPDGRYMGRFTFKDETYTLYDKELKKLKKRLADRQYEVEHGMFAKEENITVESWFTIWLNEYKVNRVKQRTIVIYQTNFRRYIAPILGKKKLKEIRPEQIQKLFNDLVSRGYSNTVIDLVNIVLFGMYKQAVKNGIVQKNPVELTTLPKKKKKEERRVLSMQEQKLFLQYAENDTHYTLYQVALFTGMRSGELRALQWEDIDFKNETIKVNGTLNYFSKQGHVKGTPKTATSERTIPMIEGIAQVLKKHRLEQKKLQLLMGTHWVPDNELNNLVFTVQTGKPIRREVMKYHIDKIVHAINEDEQKRAISEKREAILFKPITPHTFRHTFATRGIENGITPKVMQEILGHSTLSMTMDLYAHVLPDMKANEIKKIANLF